MKKKLTHLASIKKYELTKKESKKVKGGIVIMDAQLV